MPDIIYHSSMPPLGYSSLVKWHIMGLWQQCFIALYIEKLWQVLKFWLTRSFIAPGPWDIVIEVCFIRPLDIMLTNQKFYCPRTLDQCALLGHWTLCWLTKSFMAQWPWGTVLVGQLVLWIIILINYFIQKKKVWCSHFIINVHK